MKRIRQFRFHSADSSDSLNYPINYLDNWLNNILAECGPASHLGIQGEPGVVFYLNGGDNPISLGSTGIYELDLEGVGLITKLRFEDKIQDLYTKEQSELHRLIVDVIYEGPEVS